GRAIGGDVQFLGRGCSWLRELELAKELSRNYGRIHQGVERGRRELNLAGVRTARLRQRGGELPALRQLQAGAVRKLLGGKTSRVQQQRIPTDHGHLRAGGATGC